MRSTSGQEQTSYLASLQSAACCGRAPPPLQYRLQPKSLQWLIVFHTGHLHSRTHTGSLGSPSPACMVQVLKVGGTHFLQTNATLTPWLIPVPQL